MASARSISERFSPCVRRSPTQSRARHHPRMIDCWRQSRNPTASGKGTTENNLISRALRGAPSGSKCAALAGLGSCHRQRGSESDSYLLQFGRLHEPSDIRQHAEKRNHRGFTPGGRPTRRHANSYHCRIAGVKRRDKSKRPGPYISAGASVRLVAVDCRYGRFNEKQV